MRKYLLVVCFLLFVRIAFSQSLDLSEYSLNVYQTKFIRTNASPAFWNEAPPLLIKGESYQYIFTTYYSTMWNSTESIGKPKDDVLHVGSWQGNKPQWILASSHWWGRFFDPNHLQNQAYQYHREWENFHWRRNYNGIFSAHVVEQAPSDQKILFALSHGENKNEKIDEHLYQNTVRPDFIINVNDNSTYSGGKPYKDSWKSYFGFLNGNWVSYSKENEWGSAYLHDIGPVAWPSAGYLKSDGTQASKGLRHPSSIIHDDYLYIYVIDESMNGKAGVKLIRAHLHDLLTPAKYESWSKGGWVPALPEGFTKERASDYFKKQGPQNTPVFPPGRNTIRFSVAKIKGTDEFIGVEEYIMGGGNHTIKAAFRFSKDLIHWSARMPFYAADNWSSSTLRYPIFLDREGISNTEIDIEEFYVLGASGNGTVTKMHFNLDRPIFPNYGSEPNGLSPNALAANVAMTTGDAGFMLSPVPAYLTVDIQFTVGTASKVIVNLYDARGVKVRTLLDAAFQPQSVTKTFDISRLQHGLYVLELIQNDKRHLKKFIKI